MKIDLLRVACDSTNTYASAHDLPHNTVVASPTQSGGKGRNGRRFISETGGAYFSVVRLDDLPIGECARYMLAAPLAVADCLQSYGVEATIKWPNDVLVDGAKICGVLVETSWRKDKVIKAVVGIGVNVNNDVSSLDCRAINMRALTGSVQSVDEIILDISARLDSYLGENVATLAAKMRERLYTLGKTVVLPDGQEGIATELAPDGSLVVTTAQGERKVTAGDVIVKEDIC